MKLLAGLATGVFMFAMATVSEATVIDGFESGYLDGSILPGQNGWVATQWDNRISTEDNAGRLAGGLWGVRSNYDNSGAKKSHGYSLTNGLTLNFGMDVFLPSFPTFARGGLINLVGVGNDQFISFELTTDGNKLGFEVKGFGGYKRLHNDAWSELVSNDNEWYRVTLSYTFGEDALINVTRYFNGAQTTRSATAAEISPYLSSADLLQLQAGYIEAWSGAQFDNLRLAPVPEPATMLLFVTGIAGLVGTRIRRKK